MNITQTLVREVLTGCLDDDPVMKTLIAALVQPIPREALISYLFNDELIEQALIQRLREDADGTFDDLCALADGLVPDGAASVASGHGAESVGKSRSKQSSHRHAKGSSKAQRRRVNDISGLKQQVIAFLRDNPRSSRGAICNAVHFASNSVYNRVIGSLRAEGLIDSEGERWQMVYSATVERHATQTGTSE